MDLAELQCPCCGARLTGRSIDHVRRLARCQYCKTLTVLRPEPSDSRLEPRGIVPRPEKLKVIESEHALTIRWRSSSPIFVALLFFCIPWNALLIYWYTTPSVPGNPWPLAVVGVAVTYLALAGLVRRTVISVTPESFRLVRSPWPWAEKVELTSDQIRQLSVQPCSGTTSSARSLYDVYILGDDGRQIGVIKGLVDEQQAHFLEQKIERLLKLNAAPVDQGLQGE